MTQGFPVITLKHKTIPIGRSLFWVCHISLYRLGNNKNLCIEWQLQWILIDTEVNCDSISDMVIIRFAMCDQGNAACGSQFR